MTEELFDSWAAELRTTKPLDFERVKRGCRYFTERPVVRVPSPLQALLVDACVQAHGKAARERCYDIPRYLGQKIPSINFAASNAALGLSHGGGRILPEGMLTGPRTDLDAIGARPNAVSHWRWTVVQARTLLLRSLDWSLHDGMKRVSSELGRGIENWRFLVCAQIIAKIELGIDRRALADACSTGLTILRTGGAIVSDRPTRAAFDEAGEPHSETGPALEWSDGWKLFALHGTVVPESFIVRPKEMSGDEIRALTNTEHVRALAGHIGWLKVMDALGTLVFDRWVDPKTGLHYELHRVPREEHLRRPVHLSAGIAERLPQQSFEDWQVRSMATFIKKQSPVTKQDEQPWYLEPVPPMLASAKAARKWQAMAAFVEDEREAMALVEFCNENPELEYDWEA